MDLTREQPPPELRDGPSVQSMVIADMHTREQTGIERYGTALHPHNGRDALRDLYEELLDGVMYVRQLIAERDNPGRHDYLSTACLHDRHDHCKATVGTTGPKKPGVCKFCEAPCRCACHKQDGWSQAAGVPTPGS